MMRYAEYHKKIARLDQEIAECLAQEDRAASGKPWYLKVMPSLAMKAIEASNRKRCALARERAKLVRETFGGTSLLWNADPTAVFRRTVPGSSEAVEQLRTVADAAFDQQN
jgi:hypothetical protein